MTYADSIEEALKDSECALIITEWDEFRKLKPDDFKRFMRTPTLIDGRIIFDFKEFNENVQFRAIGRN
ncbi:MAG: UDP binding domain-containing protein [Promethearchaeota archaeon]